MLTINLATGTTFTVQKRVTEEDASLNYGSGQLDTVLATPSLVALVIEGAVEAIDSKLPEGIISVGAKMEFEHTNATVIGATVSIEGEIAEFDGRKAVINFTAYDEVGEIGSGVHERLIVSKDGMMIKAHERSEAIKNKNY
jgi:predicted thioesterase